jgi:hypothetical protein
MSNLRFVVFTALCVSALTACQRQFSGEDQTSGVPQPDSAPQLIQGADGTQYDVACIQGYAQQIAQGGKTVLDSACRENPDAPGMQQRYFCRGTGNNWYAYYYYPPYYYNQNGNNNYFWSYLFGSYWNNNYYYELFGYSPNYYSYYQSQCTYCYYYSSGCYNSCYKPWTVVY